MSASAFYNSIKSVQALEPANLVAFFGYFQQVELQAPSFNASSIAECYKACDLRPPDSIAPMLSKGLKTDPPRYIKVDGGYRLERWFKEQLSQRLGPERIHVQTSVELRQLEKKVSDGAARAFLKETIDCFEAGATRATIIMCWILVMDHIIEYVMKNHLAEFNAKLALETDKNIKIRKINARGDFSELPESVIIRLMRSADIINKDERKILDDKLGTRNTAAHASIVVVKPSKAIDFVSDLVENIILKFPV